MVKILIDALFPILNENAPGRVNRASLYQLLKTLGKLVFFFFSPQNSNPLWSVYIRSRQKTVWVAGKGGLLLRLGCGEVEDEGEMGLVAGDRGRDPGR